MIKKSAFSVLICSIILFLGVNAHAQFMVDTINVVEITGNKSSRKPNFNTFTNNVSLNASSFGFTVLSKDNPNNNTSILALAIRAENNKNARVRLDSVLIKSSYLDTSKISLSLNVYANSKLYSKAGFKVTNRKGKVSTLHFVSALYLPPGISYIGFDYQSKENFSFTFYTNKKVEGYLHSYNKEKDEFKLIPCEECPPATCPQVKIYYTKLED